MKRYTFSFLFFLYLCFLQVTVAFSYEFQKDSLEYYNEAVESPRNENDLQKSYAFFLKYYESATKRADTLAVIFGLQRLSTIEYKVGLYVESENSIVEALTLMDDLEPSTYLKRMKISLYNQLALLYQEFKLYSKAKDLYRSSLKFAETAKDSLILYNNLGYNFLEKGEYLEAKPYLLNALKLEPRVEDSINVPRLWANLGYVEHKLNFGNGLDMLVKALDKRKQGSDLEGIYSSYKLLSGYYLDLKQKETSKRYIDSAYALAQKIKSLSFQQDALKLMSLQNTPEIVQKYFEISDSLKRTTTENQSKFTLIKYDAEKARTDALKNKLDAERQKLKFLIVLLAFILISIAAIGYTIWLKAKAKEKHILAINDTEARISKKIHDEVANDVFQFMTKLQSNTTSYEQLVDDLEPIYNKTRNISKEYTVLDPKCNFEDALNDLILSFNSTNTNIVVKDLFKINWYALSEIKRTTIYKVLQELLINMKKHSQATVVVLTFSTHHKKIVIGYSDNGIGCNMVKSTGLQNVENRIESIKGTVTFESSVNKGFKMQFTI